MYVDVRDIAQAHVLALQKEQAGGNRFIIAAGPFKWQDFGELFKRYGVYRSCLRVCAHAVSAAHQISDKILAGNLSYDPAKAQHALCYENKKGIDVLGMSYRGVEELTEGSLDDFKARGWL